MRCDEPKALIMRDIQDNKQFVQLVLYKLLILCGVITEENFVF